ncbi:MAG: hypothetical protein Q7K55_08600 [Candidatus Levybacteria bacterium]|nr:hypothetical protein [Candidatus Levybacteria bacterium]
MKIFKYKIFFDFKIDSFPRLNFRPFIAGFTAVFIMTIISSLGFKMPEFKAASFSKPADINIIDIIRTKLKIDKNDYKLFKEQPFISNSFAILNFNDASSYISVNFDTGKVISEKDPDKKLAIASLTKIMTAVVVSKKEGQKILAVLLGAPGVIERDLWIARLLDISFENTLGLPPVAINTDQLMQKYGTWKYFN